MAPHRLRMPRPRSSATTREVRSTDPAASMALIFDAMKHPVDPLYEDFADRRARSGEGQIRRPGRSPLFAVTVVLLGFLLGAAAHALRVPASVEADRRGQLVKQVEAKQQSNDEDAAEVRRLRTELDASRSSALTRQERTSLGDDLASAERAAGAAAVKGRGVKIVLDKAGDTTSGADSDPRTGENKNAVTSTDLQQVTNGLWSAGATAVSVNDQRITSLSAIRFAGSAVLVNYRPLATPYTVEAVGPATMKGRFDAGVGGHYLDGLRKSGFDVATSDGEITIPAQDTIRLSHAQPLR